MSSQLTVEQIEAVLSKIKDESKDVSFTFGFRLSFLFAFLAEERLVSLAGKLKFLHMTGLRLGDLSSTDCKKVLDTFWEIAGLSKEDLSAKVIGHAQWGSNMVLLLQLSKPLLAILRKLNALSVAERNGTVYMYFPSEEDQASGVSPKEPHVSLGKPDTWPSDPKELFPVGTDVLLSLAFIKREGPFDPTWEVPLF
jgi:hypothetical protein